MKRYHINQAQQIKKFFLLWLTMSSFLFFTRCKKYLEVDLPSNLTLTENVFASEETANGAMLNIYGQLFSGNINPYWLSYLTSISGDELIPYNPAVQSTYLNAGTSAEGFTGFVWDNGYNLIYQANAVLEGCEMSKSLPARLKGQLKSEALFSRAYFHFLLYNLFGDIPIVTTTDYPKNAVVTRKSKIEVYAQIVADLNKAIIGLNDKYVTADGIRESVERIRPNKAAATALLARVYLYMEQYEQSAILANSLIENSNYKLTDINGVFLANSSEAIWQLKFLATSTYNTPEANQYILRSAPALSNRSEISKQLLYAFDTSDLRRTSWIGKLADNSGIDYYYPFKYKIRTGADGKEYSTVFRLAEQYLIRSESRVYLNNISAGIEDLDVIRKRAGLPLIAVIKPDISKSALLDSILAERRREFFVEFGHRWFDLKRTKTVDQVMSIVSPAKGGAAWNTNKQLWPIPQTEIIANPNLKQNEGYN